jgi:hypothetical protein
MGPGRRRKWSSEARARIVAEEALAPGAVVADVARRWHVCPRQVFDWRRETWALARVTDRGRIRGRWKWMPGGIPTHDSRGVPESVAFRPRHLSQGR